MSLMKTQPYSGASNPDNKESTFLFAIKQALALATNVSNDTVSVVRRENDTFYDMRPVDRLHPGTNGPRVVFSDVTPAVDRITQNVAQAFYDPSSVEALPYGEEDKPAAEQATKITRHAIFNMNNGKLILRDSIKSAAKYPFGGVLRIIKDVKTVIETYEMLLPDMTTLEEAKSAANVIAMDNSSPGYVEWKLRKIRQEKYEVAQNYEGEPLLDENGRPLKETFTQYYANFEICKYTITYPILVVPPEEFLINKDATGAEDADFLGQRRFMTKSDIHLMWPDVDIDEISAANYATNYNTNFSNEKQYRRRLHNTLNITGRPAVIDKVSQKSIVVEGFIKYDYNRDGIAEWRHFAMVDTILLENEEWHGPIPFFLPNLNRDPHRPDELTVAERAKDSTLAKTALIRADIKAHQARSTLQIIARNGGLPLSGQRKLMEGTAGVIFYGQNEQGAPVPGSLNDQPIQNNIMPLQKPDPSPATTSMLAYLNSNTANQVGVNMMNDLAQGQIRRYNPATNAQIQKREQDISIEDAIMCFGETLVRPLFRTMYWFILQDASHPCVKERFVRVTGNESYDLQRMRVGEFFDRDEFVINVGLGVDSPEYKQFKAVQLSQILQAANQQMSSVMPNLVPQVYEAFRLAVNALGLDPDVYFMSRQAFAAFYQQLLAPKPPPQPDPIAMANMQLIQAQAQKTAADAQVSNAKVNESAAKVEEIQANAVATIVDAMVTAKSTAGPVQAKVVV